SPSGGSPCALAASRLSTSYVAVFYRVLSLSAVVLGIRRHRDRSAWRRSRQLARCQASDALPAPVRVWSRSGAPVNGTTRSPRHLSRLPGAIRLAGALREAGTKARRHERRIPVHWGRTAGEGCRATGVASGAAV